MEDVPQSTASLAQRMPAGRQVTCCDYAVSFQLTKLLFDFVCFYIELCQLKTEVISAYKLAAGLGFGCIYRK